MKKSINMFVLLAVLSTTLPVTNLYAKDLNEDAPIMMPAEAVAISEKLIAENPDAPKGPSCIKSGVAHAPHLTGTQKKELFLHGTITDCEGNIWNIKVIPGSDMSKEMTVKSWKYAGHKVTDLIKIETYRKAMKDGTSASRASFNFAKDSSKLLKKGIWDYAIVDGLYNDLLVDTKNTWVDAASTVTQLRGSFGWIFGVIYAGLLKPVTLTAVHVLKASFHVAEGAVILVGGIAGTAGGIVATVSSPVIIPAVEIITRPVLAVGSILTTGSIIPGVLYVWNGTSWVASQFNRIPTTETIIGGVRFVSLENPKTPERKKVGISIDDFRVVVQAGVKNTEAAEKQQELEAKRAVLRRQIDELNRQDSALLDQEDVIRNANRLDPVTASLNKLFEREYGADVSLSAEVQALSQDDAKIRELILGYAQTLGVTLTEKEISDSMTSIKASIKSLSRN